jgi:uroporphyrin-III C-methyltransferase / precorrin-2 dehydrogenase / sirohydrochlorin ferrochelatase
MSYLPIFVNLKGKPCLVVGGGEVAARKVMQLLKAQGRITVIAPRPCQALIELSEKGLITYKQTEFSPAHLEGAWLVIAATNDFNLNRTISDLAEQRNSLVNVVDAPLLCNFIMPSIVDRAPVQIAISTGGASPVLARLLKARLETLIPAAYGRLAAVMAAFRDRAKRAFPDTNTRRRFWEKVLHGPVAEMLFAGQEKPALATLERLFEDESTEPEMLGEVYLVGGGPGDPDLLTFRALRLMQQADVVLYDRLVAPAILDLARKDAERIYVGKQKDQHTLPQEKINEMLLRLARQGKRVLRLKGGDPFIFGRGGEEIDTLSAHGIPFQVVPGITAASGCACYAGIPLTHRDYAHSCIFVTGHLREGTLDLNWEALVQPKQTIAIYMGLHGLDILCRAFIDHGLSPVTPMALIQQGTTPNQRVWTGTLSTLPLIIKNQTVRPPSLVIVGEVVKLHEKLAWFRK